MLNKFSFTDCKLAKTPMFVPAKIHDGTDGIDINAIMYRGMIIYLLYHTTSFLEIMFVTSICALYQGNPKESHLKAVKRIFRYPNNCPNLGL